MMSKIDIAEKFEQIKAYWTPYIIAELNGQYIKLAKLKGEFCWHSHESEDECFQVYKGSLQMEYRDRIVQLDTGYLMVVPAGVEHNPFTRDDEECWVILFEPKSTKHTGEVVMDRTNNDQQWI